MTFKPAPWWIWVVACAVLMIGTARMPYGYYTIERIVVCGIAAYLAYAGWEGGILSRICAIGFGFVALLFNPILPIHLSRRLWFQIDAGTALFFVMHLIMVLVLRYRSRPL